MFITFNLFCSSDWKLVCTFEKSHTQPTLVLFLAAVLLRPRDSVVLSGSGLSHLCLAWKEAPYIEGLEGSGPWGPLMK